MEDPVPERIGGLAIVRALDCPELLGAPVRAALTRVGAANQVGAVEIDPELADTGAFCDRYGVRPDESANCVIVAARREGTTRFAACVVLATTRTDVNGVVRRRLGARKVSFASMDDAISRTGMDYGGITPIGLPAEWPLLIDDAVARHPRVVVGSGLRESKLVVPGQFLSSLPRSEVIDRLGH